MCTFKNMRREKQAKEEGPNSKVESPPLIAWAPGPHIRRRRARQPPAAREVRVLWSAFNGSAIKVEIFRWNYGPPALGPSPHIWCLSVCPNFALE